MSDRLQFFREQMAAFEGTSNPQETIDKGYFVEQPRHSLANTIANRIALRPSSSHLLVGAIGSGKTTQLMIARDRINEIDDLHAVYVDASLYTDISEIKPSALIAITALILSDLDKDNPKTSVTRESIEKQAKGYKERKKVETTVTKGGFDFLDSPRTITEYETVVIKHEGILDSHSRNDKNNLEKRKLVENVRRLQKYINSKEGKIVVIIDGLDRLPNTEVFSHLVHSDIDTISDIGIGIIVVGSLAVAYSPNIDSIQQLFDYYYYQPCFDIDKDKEAYSFLHQLLITRAKKNFIQEQVIKMLIIYSGGVLRDLINLTQSSIEEVYMSDGDKIEQKHVEIAIDFFGKSKMLGTSNEELATLKKHRNADNFIPRTQSDIKLLASQRILEYQYPKARYAVHPAIKTLLKKSSL